MSEDKIPKEDLENMVKTKDLGLEIAKLMENKNHPTVVGIGALLVVLDAGIRSTIDKVEDYEELCTIVNLNLQTKILFDNDYTNRLETLRVKAKTV